MLKKIGIISAIVFLAGIFLAIENASDTRASNIAPESLITFADEDYGKELHTEQDLPDFTRIGGGKLLKVKFFDFLQPIVEAENERILRQRNFLKKSYLAYKKGWELNEKHFSKLNDIASEYKLRNLDFNSESAYKKLLIRVDQIPEPLALVQAAIESAWGTSYFAREGNNLFGQWCFTEGCGLVPRGREEGLSHEVKVFGSVNEAVRAYMRNLNTHAAYTQLRNIRYQMRQKDQELKSEYLALGLQKYSAKGMEYVKTIRSMLKTNNDLLLASR